MTLERCGAAACHPEMVHLLLQATKCLVRKSGLGCLYGARRVGPRALTCNKERKVCMSGCSPAGNEPSPHACTFYRQALLALQAAQVPFLVGGGYALAHYAGIMRH